MSESNCIETIPCIKQGDAYFIPVELYFNGDRITAEEVPLLEVIEFTFGDLAPMKCYYDNCDAWSVNEITINWNSPVVWISSFMDDYKDASAPVDGDTKPTEKPTEATDKPTDKPTEATDKSTEGKTGDILYGDANVDGKVDIMDAIVCNKNLVGAGDFPSEKGKKNCDINADGKFDSDDGLNVLKLAFEILKQSDCPVK